MRTETSQFALHRSLKELADRHQMLLMERFARILPVLLLLLQPRDILERNRAWPGVSPSGKAATRLLVSKPSSKIRKCIVDYAARANESADDLWQLLRAYCRYGPLGLIEALPSELPPLIPKELQECADFHRLAKHPRSNAGMYIRQLLDCYADELGLPRLPGFVARYAWATDRMIERWFFGEHEATQDVVKATKRQNLDLSYPHQQWIVWMAPLGISCILSHRHPIGVDPWLIWITDTYTPSLMGIRVCATRPTKRDLWLAFRWSVWHYGAPWWKARGAPTEMVVPKELAEPDGDIERALTHLGTRVLYSDTTDAVMLPLTSRFAGLPEKVSSWLDFQVHQASTDGRRLMTVAAIQSILSELLQEAMQEDVIARPTPLALAEQDCSLPWSTGIAAALLLPSAGTYNICQGEVSLWGIPFDLSESGIPDGEEVDLRYNPDDARLVYVVYNNAWVAQAEACAFEHRVAWSELINDPAALGKVQTGALQ